VARVECTANLTTRFPELAGVSRETNATTVAELVAELERELPGFAFYVCDELGRLRQHVNVFVDGEMIADRRALGDRVLPTSRVFIAQALSGG
jgi:sulfur-carrier protein